MLLKVFCTYDRMTRIDFFVHWQHPQAFSPSHPPRYGPKCRDIDTRARWLAFPGYVQFKVDRAARTVRWYKKYVGHEKPSRYDWKVGVRFGDLKTFLTAGIVARQSTVIRFSRGWCFVFAVHGLSLACPERAQPGLAG
jgi:hypothetical protein